MGKIFEGPKAPKVKSSDYAETPEDKRGLDPNYGASLKEAENRKRRLAANRNRTALRSDLNFPVNSGAGVSIRGTK